jgi:peptidoglycan/xylan/chitin deacetylase (PgdA/CDA1 family)
MTTQVCITVDTEFDIAGAFADPWQNQPRGREHVLYEVNGRSEGLGFMLDVFQSNGIQATFFVEALNSFFFGDEPMRDLARRIVTAGHDVQLHLHPCWTAFRDPHWREHLSNKPPNDSMAGRTKAEAVELLRCGMEIFARWGMPPVTAVRTGGLQVDYTVYGAMRACGLKVASNVGLAVYRPTDTRLHLHGGRHWIDGVLELPTLTYRRPTVGRRLNEKTLTITGSCWLEIEALLWQAHATGVSPVVLLTHPHEYVKAVGNNGHGWRRNRVNQTRLEKLCRFLARHRDTFSTVRFRDGSPAWLDQPPTDDPLLHTSVSQAVYGMAENKFNDYIPWS